jgi:hypothetical protein
MFSFTGKLVVKSDTQQVTDSFRKREFVMSDESSQYPQEIMFQLTQDRCSLLDPMNVGETVKVNFNLRGRKWENPNTKEIKYFNTLEAWRLEKETSSSPLGSDLPPMPSAEPAAMSSESDDLPF